MRIGERETEAMALGFTSTCLPRARAHPTDDQAEIINGRWDEGSNANSKSGRKAPQHSKIRLFGAFLSIRGDEFVPVRKRDRHLQIHREGWS